jgi:HlyD family secretion protein
MYKTRYVYLALALAVPLLISGCKLGGEGKAAAAEPLARAVRVAEAVAATPQDSGTQVSGVVQAQGQVELGFQMGGQVTAVYVDIGDHVRKGQVLARLDAVPYSAQRDQAAGALGQAQAHLSLYEEGTRRQEVAMVESQVRSAEAVQARVEADLHRVQELYAKGVVAKQKLDEAESGYVQACEALRAAQEQLDIANEGPRAQEVTAARAAVLQAKGAYTAANRQLEYATLTAPADGTIVYRNIEPGMTVDKGAPVFELADMGRLEVRAEVPETRLADIKVGEQVQIGLPALPGVTCPAHIENIAPEAQAATRGFPIKLVLESPSVEIVPGMVALIRFGGAVPAGGIRIQRRSIYTDAVFVVKDGVAHECKVQILNDEGEQVVVSGLQAGDQVVINGQQYIKDGEQVNVVGALAIDEITGLDGKEAQ